MKYVPADCYQEATYTDHLAKNSIKHYVLKKLRGVVNNSSLYQYVSSQKYRKLHDRWREDNWIASEVECPSWMWAILCNVPEKDNLAGCYSEPVGAGHGEDGILCIFRKDYSISM